jgi:hypothetical protein
MAWLTVPIPDVRLSFVAAMAEFRAEGRGLAGDLTMLAWEMQDYGSLWGDADGFAHFVRLLRAQALEQTPRPAHFVPVTTLWWVEGKDYLGG